MKLDGDLTRDGRSMASFSVAIGRTETNVGHKAFLVGFHYTVCIDICIDIVNVCARVRT